MKNIKRIASILLALIVAMAMMTAAFAEEPETGSITINGIVVNDDGTLDVVYEVYQLLDLESYSTEGKGAYSYRVNEAWVDFFKTETAKTYITFDENGYAKWTGSTADSDIAEFAKLALAYAKENGIKPVQSSSDGKMDITGNSGKFSGLPLGYYLVDSNVGVLCGLTTTNPNASLNAKNGRPTVDKTVHDQVGDQWIDSNSANIGETVEFRTTITVHAGAQNYVLHDTMSDGLTFDAESVHVRHVVSQTEAHDVGEEMYEIVTEGMEDDCTFEIVFSQEFCDHLSTNDRVVIYYNAVLNEDAVIAGDGNDNETWLDYGEGHHTTHDNTVTYTYGIDIIKTDSQNTLIPGAVFRIYDALTGGNEIAVVVHKTGEDGVEGDERVIEYRVAQEGETGVDIEVVNGAVRIVGLSSGTYYLEEIDAPDGYNKLSARHRFDISGANVYATFNNEIYSVGSGVQVVNNTGTMLPETGGIGTTLFYVIGGVLVAAAVVLLVTRKRMSEK